MSALMTVWLPKEFFPGAIHYGFCNFSKTEVHDKKNSW
jgi:hypothetical protein